LVVFPCAGHTSSMHQPGERGERSLRPPSDDPQLPRLLRVVTVRLRRRASSTYETALGPGLFWVEPPIGIEPMTYALRGRFGPPSAVHQFTATLLIDVYVPDTSRTIQGCC
jgi:hypothetical protein